MVREEGYDNAGSSPALRQALLLTVIEQLKQPLLHIARQAELSDLPGGATDLRGIRVTADTALRLLDNYLLGVQLAGQQDIAFAVEPLSVASVLYDVGNRLRPLAGLYGVTLDLQVDGRYGPVMAHRRGLEAALTALGHALVEALPARDDAPQLTLRLSAHRCRYGIVAGMYSEASPVTARVLRLGRQLYASSRQPLAAMTHAGGAGVFVADALLHAMHTQLSASRHKHLQGLGAVLPLSTQLRLV